jgi:glycosyltransferase involved in cell wall biosynthesis
MSETPSLAESGAHAAPERPLVTHFLYGYRQERTIRAAIEGVFAQTYQPLEIVLSDDCSPDGTFRIMQEMAEAYSGPHRIVLNRNPTNLGIGRHVERIMELSSGSFVVESGGDDISLPERAERLVAAWLASGRRSLAVHSEKHDMDETGDLLDFAPRPDILAGITPLQMLQKKHIMIGATLGWARELYDRFGPVSDIASFHDYPLCFRALLLGDVAYVPEPLVHYRIGGISRHKVQSYGHWYFYGDRIRYMRWDLEFYRSYRRDLERLPPPDAARCRAVCDSWIREAEFTIALADTDRRRRLATLPRALGLSLRHRDSVFLRMTIKYLLDRPFMRYLDWKTERRQRRNRRHSDPAQAT